MARPRLLGARQELESAAQDDGARAATGVLFAAAQGDGARRRPAVGRAVRTVKEKNRELEKRDGSVHWLDRRGSIRIESGVEMSILKYVWYSYV